jgi:coproporphyrinogen III oxidase-like Fe-S oxidoreductase
MKETLMEAQQLLIQHPFVMSDPEWIALESIEEQTQHFVFDVSMLHVLKGRGLVEATGERWRITERGHRRLHDRVA